MGYYKRDKPELRKKNSIRHFIEHLEYTKKKKKTHRHVNRTIVPTDLREVRKRSDMIHMTIQNTNKIRNPYDPRVIKETTLRGYRDGYHTSE